MLSPALTTPEILDSNTPTLGKLQQQLGDKAVHALLVMFIGDLCSFFNVGKAMNASQISQTASLIIWEPEYKMLKPEDFKKFFHNAKRMKYGSGKVFDRIDGGVIFEWLDEYISDRTNETITFRQTQLQNISQSIKKPLEGLKEVQMSVQSVIDKERLERQKNIAPTQNKKSQQELYNQQCMNTFQKIKMRREKDSHSKFYNRGGIMMSLEMYLKFRNKKLLILIEKGYSILPKK